MINEIDALLKTCAEKTNYPSRLYLTNNYKKKNIQNFSDIVDEKTRKYYNSELFKIKYDLLYTNKIYTFSNIASIRNDLSYFLKKPIQYIELRKRIKTPDLYEKCYLYASGYPYGRSLASEKSKNLKNIDEVQMIAEQVYLLAYKHHMVSYIMSTDSQYASVPIFLLQKYKMEGRYAEQEEVNQNNSDMKIDEDFLEFIFNYLDLLTR